MTIVELTSLAVGLYGGGTYLDEICDRFGVSITKEDIFFFLKESTKDLGNRIALQLFLDIEEKAVTKLGLDRDYIHWNINGDCDTRLFYAEEEIEDWEQLEKIAETKNVRYYPTFVNKDNEPVFFDSVRDYYTGMLYSDAIFDFGFRKENAAQWVVDQLRVELVADGLPVPKLYVTKHVFEDETK